MSEVQDCSWLGISSQASVILVEHGLHGILKRRWLRNDVCQGLWRFCQAIATV